MAALLHFSHWQCDIIGYKLELDSRQGYFSLPFDNRFTAMSIDKFGAEFVE
jgi:hypothetical protein